VHAWVTGATGFVGSSLVARLLERGAHVVALVRPQSKERANPGAELVEAVLPAVGRLADLPRPDIVFHCAAVIDGSQTAARGVHVEGTVRLAELTPNARFVHLSTTEVSRPRDAYGRTKLEGERRLLALRPDAIVLRPPGIYGPRSERDVVLQIARRIERGRYFHVGDGEAKSSWIFVETLVDAMLHAAEHRELVGAYFVDDGQPISRRELAREIAVALGKPASFRQLPLSFARPLAFALERALPVLGLEPPLTSEGVRQASTDSALDTTRWRATGFVPRFSQREAIAATVDWARAVGRLLT
jgi:nucleoside-diphosphate-sugar epimerase